MAKFIVEAFTDGVVTLKVPGNNYRNAFKVAAGASVSAAGEPVQGTIRASAWKVEAVSAGGNYVEPLYGRPRRMQGMVLAVNEAANELTVRTPYEVTVTLPGRYKAANYPVGTRVGFDCLEMPLFEVAGAAPAQV